MRRVHAAGTAAQPGPTLNLVNAPADATPGPGVDVVVLDSSWTPDAASGETRVPLRPALLDVLDTDNLFLTSIAMLDAWAEACALPERFAFDGVSWWFHARSFVRLDLQELLLWGRLLDRLAPAGQYTEILVPRDRPRLLEAARATVAGWPHGSVHAVEGSSISSSDLTGRPAENTWGPPDVATAQAGPDARSGLRAAVARVVGRRARGSSREQVLFERVERLARLDAPVLGLVRPASYHAIAEGDVVRRRDPYLGAVIEGLERGGRGVALVAMHTQYRRKTDWPVIEADARLIPQGFLRHLEDDDAADRQREHQEEIAGRLAGIPAVPIHDGDRDLGPSMIALVGRLGPWLAGQWRELSRAGLVMDRLQPSALVTGWEAARTSWLAAAHARGIPTVAIQHGVIYPDTPDYCRPASPLLLLPDLTCVYGPYERAVLTGQGGYPETLVEVTGSPRIDPGRILAEQRDPAVRAAIRHDLSVADGHRLMVVSGGRMTVGDRMGTLPLLGRVLDGPLRDVHLVVKLHPEEPDGDHYRHLLEGLARAGGYACPPIGIVRDMDLYDLLQAADVHLGVLSTVLTDSVLAGTPNLIVVGQAQADLIGYVAAGVATPVRTVQDVQAWLANPIPLDAVARRRFVEAHFKAGDAAARVVTALGRTGKLSARDHA